MMDVLFAHDPIRRAIFAHLSWHSESRSQSATLLAQYRAVSREWRAAIPAPPKFCAYIKPRNDAAMNPAASGDIVAMHKMFDETSICRWIEATRKKYAEQSVQIIAKFGTSCGIVPESQRRVLQIIGRFAEIRGCSTVDCGQFEQIPNTGNFVVDQMRALDGKHICSLASQPEFSRELRNIKSWWEVPIESKLHLLRGPFLYRSDIERIAMINTQEWSVLEDRELINYVARGGPLWMIGDAQFISMLIMMCIFHVESRADVARIIKCMRECGYLDDSLVAQANRRFAHTRKYGVLAHLRMLREAAQKM